MAEGQTSRRRGALSAPGISKAVSLPIAEEEQPTRRNSAGDLAGLEQPDPSQQRRRSNSFSSFVQQPQKTGSDSDLKIDAFELGEDGEEEEEEEDSGHLIKQLLINLSSLVVNSQRLRRRSTQDGSVTPAERLLGCIKKVLATTYTRSIQGRLQDLILLWVNRPLNKQTSEVEVDIDAKLHARRIFWDSFQANTQKWEGMGRDLVLPCDDEDGEEDPQALLLQKMALQSPADGHKKGLSGSYTGARDARPQRSYSTLSHFGKSNPADSMDHCTEASEPVDTSMIALFDSAVGMEKKVASTLSHKPSTRTVQIPSRRATRLRAASAPSKKAQSRPHSHGGWPCGQAQQQDRYIFGAAQSKAVPKMHRARLCLAKPNLKPLQLETAPQESTVNATLRSPSDLKQEQTMQVAWASRPSGKPAPFACPPEGRNSAAIVQSGEWKYFKECERLRMLPRVPPFLINEDQDRDSTGDSAVGQSVYRFSLAGRSLLDRDLIAFGPPLQMLEAEVMTIDLSNNGFTDHGLAEFLSGFEAPDVRELSLSHTGAKGMTIDAVLQRMKYDWTSLQALNLSSCHLPGNMWATLCEQLIEFKNIVNLDMSDTSLGRVSQQHVAHVSRFVSSSSRLQHLDLSGNYLLHDGFEVFSDAIHHTSSLTSLDLSYNACIAVVQSRRQRLHKDGADKGGDLVKGPGGELYQDLPNFNPVALLCEALSHNTSLKELRLVATFLDYSADCSLLLSLLANDVLEFLDVSDNPHGEEGLGTILRLIVHPDQNLVYCDIKDFRDGTNGPGIVRLDFGALSGHYELELRHPQHRAVIRWLLRAAENSGLRSPLEAFKEVSWSPAFGTGGRQSPWSWATDRGWAVADSGHLSFNFTLKVELQEEPTVAAALNKWHKTQRMTVTMSRFVPLLAMFKRLSTNEQKIQFAKAMGDTLLFKMCHLQKLMQAAPALSQILAKLLYPRLTENDQLLIFDLMDSHPYLARVFRREARMSFFFNDNNPTAHYDFHLDSLIDRTMAERLHVINHFDMLLAQRAGGPDTSQYGNWEGVRNSYFLDKKFTSFVTFAIPDHGCLSLDYVSPRHASTSVKDRAATNIFIKELVEALDSSVCCPEDKVSALRTISHQLVLTPEQVEMLFIIFPNPRVKTDAKKRVTQMVHSLTRRNSMRNLALGLRKKKRSAFQFRLDNCRLEAFVMLFCQCNNAPAICTFQCLWNPRKFSPACSRSARERLGKVRTLDALHCGRPYSQFANMEQVVDTAMQGLGRPSVARASSADMGARRQTVVRSSTMDEPGKAKASMFGMGRSLAAAKAIQALHEMEVGRRYALHLDVHEDWTIGRFILELSEREECTNLNKCSWSERKMLEDQGLEYVVPSGWYVHLPQEGLFSCTLVSDKEDADIRRELAIEILGWEKQ